MCIETLYQEFYRSSIQGCKHIDFVGVNCTSDPSAPFLFKTYQHIGANMEQLDSFLELLERKDMIKNYLPVRTSDPSRVQYDVRLANRTDVNMQEVMGYLAKNLAKTSKFSIAALSEISYFSRMSITDLPNHTMSALYFLGLQWNDGRLSVLKSHFLTRKIVDPDHFSSGFWYDDDYFLSYIRSVNNKPCGRLAEITGDLLRCLEGHLWMFGLDVFRSHDTKYKIYLKNAQGLDLSALRTLLVKYQEFAELSFGLQELYLWQERHSEFFLYGFALTATSNGVYGINLYYFPPDSMRGTT